MMLSDVAVGEANGIDLVIKELLGRLGDYSFSRIEDFKAAPRVVGGELTPLIGKGGGLFLAW